MLSIIGPVGRLTWLTCKMSEILALKYKDSSKWRASASVSPVVILFFFYLGFLWWTFTNNRTAGEGVGHFFNSSLPLPPASQTPRH